MRGSTPSWPTAGRDGAPGGLNLLWWRLLLLLLLRLLLLLFFLLAEEAAQGVLNRVLNIVLLLLLLLLRLRLVGVRGRSLRRLLAFQSAENLAQRVLLLPALGAALSED